MVKLVFVTLVDITGTSGQNLYSKAVATALYQHPLVDLTLVCPTPSGDIPQDLEGVDIRTLTSKRSRDPLWHVRVQVDLLATLCALRREGRPSAIVSTLKASTIIPPIISTAYGIPHVLLVEGMMAKNIAELDPFPGAEKLAQTVACIAVRKSKQVYTAYEEAAEWMKSLRNGDSPPIEVVRHGVDLNLFEPLDKHEARQTLGLPEAALTIGFVGSFKPYHSLRQLVRATAAVVQGGEDVHLHLVGDGPMFEDVQQLVDQHGLHDHVTTPGFIDQPQVPKHVAACDVMYGVIDPNHWGSPMKVYEYLACARPVITYDAEEFKFVLEQEVGWTVDDVDAQTIENVLRDVMEVNDETKVKMGKRGRRYVEENRTWSRLAQKIVSKVDAV